VIKRQGVRRCFTEVVPGLYFTGAGYALLHDLGYSTVPAFRVSSGFTASVRFRAVALDAMLMLSWHSQTCFAYLALVDGQVNLTGVLMLFSFSYADRTNCGDYFRSCMAYAQFTLT